MPRPVNYLAASVELPKGEDAIWAAMLSLHERGEPWSLAQVERASQADEATIREYLRRLIKAGRVERAGSRPARAPSRQVVQLYRVGITSLEAPRLRRDGSECPEPAIEKMWRVMRMLRTFTAQDIADAAQVNGATADRYLRQLATGGDPISCGPGRPMERSYLVVRELGPKAPKILRGHTVYDPNSQELIGALRTEEVML